MPWRPQVKKCLAGLIVLWLSWSLAGCKRATTEPERSLIQTDSGHNQTETDVDAAADADAALNKSHRADGAGDPPANDQLREVDKVEATEEEQAYEPPQLPDLTEEELEAKLVKAIVQNELEYAESLLRKGAPATAEDERGVTALHAAARGGHAWLAQMLIDRGADLEATVRPDATALHWAVRGGDIATIVVLLANGADIHAEAGYRHPTPLALAQAVGNEEVINVLLEHGARK